MDYFVEVEKSVRRSQPALYALVVLFGVLGLGLVVSGLRPHVSGIALFGLVPLAVAAVFFRFLAWLSRLAPHATYGYSKEREKAFRANPRSFLRAG